MLSHILGLDNGSGAWYLFWSGFGANFQEFAMVALAWGFLRKHNCQRHGCWRIGRHPTRHGAMLCRKHHPSGGFVG